VGELLRADPQDLALAVAEIDASLQAEIQRLEEHRKAVAQLATIDGLALPPEIVEYLDRLRSLGLSDRAVRPERDGWLLVAAQLPNEVVGWVTGKQAAFEDEEFVAMYRAFDEAYDWSPDDPRLEKLADDLAQLLAQLQARGALADPTQAEDQIDDTIAAMIDANSIGASPALRREGELIEARGLDRMDQHGTTREGAASSVPLGRRLGLLHRTERAGSRWRDGNRTWLGSGWRVATSPANRAVSRPARPARSGRRKSIESARIAHGSQPRVGVARRRGRWARVRRPWRLAGSCPPA
jgi:hypothetical protein